MSSALSTGPARRVRKAVQQVHSMVNSTLRHNEQKTDRWLKGHSASIEPRGKFSQIPCKFSERWQWASTTGQPSPSLPSQSCGRAVVEPQGTDCQSWGDLKGIGWWTLCAGQSVAAQPSERWTGTGQDRKISKSVITVLSYIKYLCPS